LPTSPWRIMFCIGAAPALLSLLIRRQLKEPETWQKASHDGAVKKQLGSYTELFSHPTWRKHAILGLLLACSGVIGLWAIGFYSPDLIRQVQLKPITAAVYAEQIASAEPERAEMLKTIQAAVATKKTKDLTVEQKALKAEIDKKIRGQLTVPQSMTSIAINVGAFFGMFGFGWLAQRIGRKPTFAIALVAAFISTAVVFWCQSWASVSCPCSADMQSTSRNCSRRG
jgi:MFS family permease